MANFSFRRGFPPQGPMGMNGMGMGMGPMGMGMFPGPMGIPGPVSNSVDHCL